MTANPALHSPQTAPKPTSHDEPEITQEESVPSDGKDVEGEKMMKKVSNKKLAETPDEAASED